MRILRKTALTILAALPVPTISIAAHSQLLALAGDEPNCSLHEDEQLKKARKMLFPKLVMTTTPAAAKERVGELTGITDPTELNEEMSKYIKILLDSGLLEVNDNSISTRIPSEI